MKIKGIFSQFNITAVYYFFLGFCLMGRGIQYAVNSFLGFTFNMFIVGAPLFVIAVLSIARTNAFRINLGNLFILIATMAAYGVSFFTSGDASSWMDVFADFVQVCLLLVLGSFFVIDFDRLFNTCKWFSLVSAVLYEIIIITRSAGLKNYMGFGYNFLLIISFLALYSYVFHKRILFVLTIFMSMQLLLYGPRMCWLLVALLYLLMLFDHIKKAWLKLLVSLVAVTAAFNYKAIILGIVNWLLTNTSFSTVTLHRFKIVLDNGDSSELLLGARYSLFARSWELIKQYPFIGIGIGGFHQKSGMPYDYPHNILLEIILDFGIVIGLVLIVLIFRLIIKALFDVRTKKNQSFFIIFVWLLINFLRLFVSQSYICDTIFFAVICFAANFLYYSGVQQQSTVPANELRT